MPRLVETPAGILHSIGLHNPGLPAVARRYPPIWSTWTVPAIVSIAGETIDEYATIAQNLDELPGISAIELNLSSPNRDTPGISFGYGPDQTAQLVEAVRNSTSLPIIAKLSPTATDLTAVALAAEQSGADTISLINSLVGLSIDVKRRRPTLSTAFGGLSGPAIKPLAVRMVHEVAGAVSVPVIGIGGIASLADVLEYLMAGASAIQIGSAIYAQPSLLTRLIDELEAWMTTQNVERLDQIVGIARVPDLDDETFTSQAVAAG